ncbi:S8 family serine peptidase [Aurantimonas sp. HBX-1]|uniref:S8 family serine peptidase n=1 Tax=Aurantimonas sp. HBX-1 TaxID=2906072 RepID=UPI001F3CC497|nr:S8 family serine peptidase [Aurantimonas sp. HBX-1]UIJ70329.1 S8 family serine peptidase [Aurantimonas sp. HBX-1]
MTYVDLLRDLGRIGNRRLGLETGLPPDELRFALEYRNQPDPDLEQSRFDRLLGEGVAKIERLAPDGQLRHFLLLRIPGVERTLPQRDLFGIAYALVDVADLVSAEPDLGSDYFSDPEPGGREPTVETADLLGPLCWVAGEAPSDRRWSLKTIRAPEAWRRSRGRGILVGQPDTGVAAHDDLEAGALLVERGFDFIRGKADPTDPLHEHTANPGHGTSTASVVASREHGAIAGAAPEACVVPIRCIEDVKVFNAAPIARAVAHAMAAGCDIISMSLGGIPSRALHAAIRTAIERDIIVLAAAGNCVRTVVWPARYEEVIGVAGTNIEDRPWKGSCRGSTVDISAPAEFVWRALRARSADPTFGVSGGQGTSFAVALVAGVAALWLEHYGRDAVIAQARARGVSVQRLFKAALQQTARRPSKWDSDDFGAGIVDADALTALPLSEIALSAPEVAAEPKSSIRSFLDEEVGKAPMDPEFPLHRYGAELGAIGLTEAKRDGSAASLSAEAKSQNTRPSPQLSSAARNSSDARLRRFSELRSGTSVERPLARAVGEVPVRRLRQALKRQGTALESTGVQSVEQARVYLATGGVRQQLDAVEAQLDAMALPQGAIDETLRGADEALSSIAAGRPLTMRALVGLEALVSLTGRPVIPVRDGAIDLHDPRAGAWRDKLFLISQDGSLPSRIRSVGRIDADGGHVGTGFVAGDGIVMTNRHVVQAFAAPVPSRSRAREWVMTSDDVTFDVGDRPNSATSSTCYRVKSVIATGPSHIDEDLIDFTDLDVALLEVEATSEGGAPLPAPLQLTKAVTAADRRKELIVIGYPARPSSLPTTNGSFDLEVVERLGELFGNDYGVKYVAPGEVDESVGSAKDPMGWTFDHDASTLGGNSGSCIVGFDAPLDVIGLHFGGQWLKANFAHSLGALAGMQTFLGQSPLNWSRPDGH